MAISLSFRHIFFFFLFLAAGSAHGGDPRWEEVYSRQCGALENLWERKPRLLILFSATPGMGKSSLSLHLEKELKALRVSADDARALLRELYGDPSLKDGEMRLEEYLYYALDRLDKESDNHLVILDRSIDGVEEESLQLAEALGYDTFVIRLQCQRSTVERRIRGREREPSLHLSRLDRWFEQYERFPEELIDLSFSVEEEWGELDLKSLEEVVEKKLKSVPATERDLPHTAPEMVGKLYSCLSLLLPILQERGIAHFAFCGTALGAVRHGGIIPWDDDIDLAFYESDIGKLLQAEEALNGAGLALYPANGYFKVMTIGGEPILKEGDPGNCYPWSYPFIDLFPMKEVEGVVHYSSERLRKGLPKEYFTIDQLMGPLPSAPFGPLALPLPHSIEEHLDRVYGSDWPAVAYAQLIHRLEKKVKKVKVRIEDYSPAEYLLP